MSEPQASILIVDDEPAVRDVFTRFFELSGFSVRTAATAEDGEREALDGQFAVIVADLNLPDATGLQLAERLRSQNCRSKFILLTGEPSQETVARARELQISRYLSKPVRASVLIEVVREVLQED